MSGSWKPQPRPEWVARLNEWGEVLGSPEVLVPLDEASLLAAAIEATGLDDFDDAGDDSWREPFRILLDDLEQHAELNLVGRLMARFDLVKTLVARLGMADAERRHPEIREQPIEAPIIVTGLGRTGTTILQELLSQDPRLRAPRGWELRYPAPPRGPATRADDPRVAKAAVDIDFWVDVVPEFLPMHESTSEGSDEDTAGLVHDFTSPVWTATHRAPGLDAWLIGQSARTARFHKRLLQHLQWPEVQGGVAGRWLVKAPTHLSMLPELFAEYPDARVIHTHRDPLKVLASTADMIATLRWQRADRDDYAEFAQLISFGYPILLDMVIEQRRTGAVPEDRFADVRFADLMDDHLGTIAVLYEQLGMELTGEAADRMRAHLAARPRDRHGTRRYRFEDLGIDEAETRAKFTAYMDRYAVPQEEL